MPAEHTDRRPDVQLWAAENGWKSTTTVFEDEMIRDVFTKGDRELRCFWLKTPHSEAIWARGYLLMPYKTPVTVPRVTSSQARPSVQTVLKLQYKHTKALAKA